MKYHYTISSLGALLLGGCSVYTPMLGAAPGIKAKGELEATAAWSFTNRLDMSATYSPVRHLLVRAAASTKGSGRSAAPKDSSYARTTQYELAVGTYWPLGQHWLVGGLAGFGQTHAEARYDDDGTARLLILRNPTRHQFDARYHKYSAEAYATYQPSPRVSLGLAYRVVQVRLTDGRYRPGRARAVGAGAAWRAHAVCAAGAAGRAAPVAAAAGAGWLPYLWLQRAHRRRPRRPRPAV